jgi:putative peptidoglycan lipid II flippase
MAVATFLSRILGLVREQVLAAKFGATGLTDAFTIAFRLPNMLRDLFAEGAFSSAFVPVFTEEKLRDPLAARRLLWSLFVLLGTVTAILSFLIIIFAKPLLYLVTDDLFTADLERVEVTVHLIRVMAPFLTFVSLAALFMGALNSLRIFFVPALAPAFFNIVMIICMITLPPVVSARGFHPIFSLGVGVLLGGFIQMAMQIPFLFKNAYGPLGPLEFYTQATRKIVNRLGIGSIGIAATQINLLVTTMLATSTLIGAVSWLNYAFRLFQFPVGILSVSIANSNLVHFSDAWKGGKKEEAIDILHKSYLICLMTIIPATALLLALSYETVVLVFERGKFLNSDSLATSKALMAYGLGLPFYGLYKILVPTFFVLDRPRVPVLISVGCIVFNLIFCLSFVSTYGYVVLALGTSLSMLLNCALQAWFIRRDLNLSLFWFFELRVFKILFAGGASYFCARFFSERLFTQSAAILPQVGQYLAVVMLTLGLYVSMVLVMGEGQILKKAFKKARK